MEYIEAKDLLENSVRCMAMSMEQIRRRLIEHASKYSEPMQDHLAQCCTGFPPYESSSMESCLEYLKQLHEGLAVAARHDAFVEDHKLYINNADEIADMMMGYIYESIPKHVMKSAREVAQTVYPLLVRYATKKSDKNRQLMVDAFIDEVKASAKRNGVRLDCNGTFSLPISYLCSWIVNKYGNFNN